jgi:hypothetical protein
VQEPFVLLGAPSVSIPILTRRGSRLVENFLSRFLLLAEQQQSATTTTTKASTKREARAREELPVGPGTSRTTETTNACSFECKRNTSTLTDFNNSTSALDCSINAKGFTSIFYLNWSEVVLVMFSTRVGSFVPVSWMELP